MIRQGGEDGVDLVVVDPGGGGFVVIEIAILKPRGEFGADAMGNGRLQAVLLVTNAQRRRGVVGELDVGLRIIGQRERIIEQHVRRLVKNISAANQRTVNATLVWRKEPRARGRRGGVLVGKGAGKR